MPSDSASSEKNTSNPVVKTSPGTGSHLHLSIMVIIGDTFLSHFSLTFLVALIEIFYIKFPEYIIIQQIPYQGISKLANALQVEVKDFFEFAHEAKNTRELKEMISSLLKKADEERLRLAVKVLRALVR